MINTFHCLLYGMKGCKMKVINNATIIYIMHDFAFRKLGGDIYYKISPEFSKFMLFAQFKES